MGMVLLVMVFSLNASSAPTPPFTTFTQFGHQVGDLGPGDFQGDSSSVYTMPGFFLARNAVGIGSGLVSTSLTGDLQLEKIEAGAQTVLEVQNASSAPNSDAVINLITSSGTGKALLSLATPLQTWAMASDNTGNLKISNNSLGDQIIVATTGDTTVLGSIDATDDVCTGLSGGQCLSQINQTLYIPTTPSTPYCNPNCTGGSLTSANKILTVTCGTGLDTTNVPIHCGGKITLPSGNSLRSYRSEALYLSMGDTVNGCILEWDTSNGSVPAGTVGFVKAVCVKVNG